MRVQALANAPIGQAAELASRFGPAAAQQAIAMVSSSHACAVLCCGHVQICAARQLEAAEPN